MDNQQFLAWLILDGWYVIEDKDEDFFIINCDDAGRAVAFTYPGHKKQADDTYSIRKQWSSVTWTLDVDFDPHIKHPWSALPIGWEEQTQALMREKGWL